MKKLISLSYFLFLISHSSFAQTNIHVYPSNWWVGMKYHTVQLLIHAENEGIGKAKVHISYPGIKTLGTHPFENGKYLAVDMMISPSAKAGTVRIDLADSENTQTIKWVLKERRKGNGNVYAQGVTSADLIYLLLPDRFSNGDRSNDRFANMNDTNCDRSNPFYRHGGDLQGITNHLDYFNDLGITALWLTPVIENDQGLTDEGGTIRSSYHGYGFTDQYQIDRRFGGNEAYKKMIDAAHTHGIKIIQDAVYNHIGNKHFLFLDPPAKDWFNQWPSYTNTNYQDQPLVDQYASKAEYDLSLKGWFTSFLPDLNQANPFVANYLVQHAIWTVEEFGIDGWRVDTYFYSDRNFLNNINKALYSEYPHISVFGETTMHSVTEQAFYMQNNLNIPWKSNLQGVTDYEWANNALASLSGKTGENGDVNKLYTTLVQDILYKDPMRNEIFYDNHDQDRFYSVMGEDLDKYKMGMALLLTQRGIPQLYYGTEILMKNKKIPSDAEVRRDFPGGWKEDTENKFTADGRNALENEAYNYVKTLAQFRKTATAIKTGKLMQFLPKDGLYIYFRYDAQQTVMCIMNTGAKQQNIDFAKYAERTKGFTKAVNIVNNSSLDISANTGIPPKTMWVLALK